MLCVNQFASLGGVAGAVVSSAARLPAVARGQQLTVNILSLLSPNKYDESVGHPTPRVAKFCGIKFGLFPAAAGLLGTKRPLFRPPVTPRGQGCDGFFRKHLTRQAVAGLFERYAKQLELPDDASVHSLRVTATNVARDQGVDIFGMQDWLNQANPLSTEGNLRKRERLSKSPAYAVRY